MPTRGAETRTRTPRDRERDRDAAARRGRDRARGRDARDRRERGGAARRGRALPRRAFRRPRRASGTRRSSSRSSCSTGKKAAFKPASRRGPAPLQGRDRRAPARASRSGSRTCRRAFFRTFEAAARSPAAKGADEMIVHGRRREGRAHPVDRRPRVPRARAGAALGRVEAVAAQGRDHPRRQAGARAANQHARRVRLRHRQLGPLERRQRRHRQGDRARSSTSTTTARSSRCRRRTASSETRSCSTGIDRFSRGFVARMRVARRGRDHARARRRGAGRPAALGEGARRRLRSDARSCSRSSTRSSKAAGDAATFDFP